MTRTTLGSRCATRNRFTVPGPPGLPGRRSAPSARSARFVGSARCARHRETRRDGGPVPIPCRTGDSFVPVR